MKNLKILKTMYVSMIMVIGFSIGLAMEAEAFERLSSRQNRVRVEVVPVQLTAGRQAKFEIRMNTHSVTLDHDLVAITLLKDSNGHEYHPGTWKGSPPGGHHRSGTLAFPAIKGNPNAVTLIVKEIANVPERTFTWKVKR